MGGYKFRVLAFARKSILVDAVFPYIWIKEAQALNILTIWTSVYQGVLISLGQ